MTGTVGNNAETWTKPNRRRLATNPLVIIPGKRGYGSECIVVGVDTSSSIGQKELDAFMAEVGGVLADIKPKRLVVIGCDAAVGTVEEVHNLDEVCDLGRKGLGGGGGTDFRPVFDYVEEKNLRPETLIFLTDLLGCFPNTAPVYPVIWCSTSKGDKAPFGETVEIELDR